LSVEIFFIFKQVVKALRHAQHLAETDEDVQMKKVVNRGAPLYQA
jgi:hypothetical protein